MKGRILIIRGGAIGDFILTLPVLAALRTGFPNAFIDVMGYPHIASLAQLAGTVNEVRPIESRALAGYFARGGDLDPVLGAYFGCCNVIFTYLFDPDSIFHTNLARVTGAQIIQGPHRPDDSLDTHATEQLLYPLQRLAIFDADAVPRISLMDSKPSRSGEILAIHPGSGSESKNWPQACWVELLRVIAASSDWQIRLVGGEAEGIRLERLAEHLPLDRVQIWRAIPLPQLASLLNGCTRFIGHDSGISHLAAAIGLPTTVLWGPTKESVWCPRGLQVEVLRHPISLAALSPQSVAKHLLQGPS